MRNNKRWIGVTALAGVTAVALIAAVAIKSNLNKAPENVIKITQEGTDLGIKQIETLTDKDGNVKGYKVNVMATGFNTAEPMELAVSFNAAADTVTGVEVISQAETDGLGGNVTKPDFLDQFNDVALPVFLEGMSVSVNDAKAANNEISLFSTDELYDGTYTVVGAEPHNGYTSQVTLTVEGGKITGVVWDCKDENGNFKSELSKNGEYVMTETGAIWADQAKALGENVVANQGVSAIVMDENGKTDAVASVSISVNEFVAQVEEAIAQASTPSQVPSFHDGTYTVVGAEPHNGYTSEVTVTVEGGKIVDVNWDCKDENGNYKSELSKNGEYVMTETGAIWADQAKALGENVVANQGVSAIVMDENGKTDAVASVSISVNEFVAQVEEALAQAAGIDAPVADTTQDSAAPQAGTQIDSISGATVTSKAVIAAINNAYQYLIENVVK